MAVATYTWVGSGTKNENKIEWIKERRENDVR